MENNKMDMEDPKDPQKITYSTKVESSGRTCKIVLIILLFLAMAACIIGLAVALANKSKEVAELQKDIAAGTTTSTIKPPVDDADRVPRSKWGQFRFGAVAADHEVCSEIGTKILARGSTVDATIATLLCVCIHHTQSCGPGGGFLATLYDSKTKKAMALISREVAPLAATEDMYVNNTGLSSTGGLAFAVPGEIAGYAAMHKRYGRLLWAELFQDVIKLCEDGHIVDESLALVLEDKESVIRDTPSFSELFLKSDGTLYKEGDYMKRPLLARTFRRIAEDGPDAFYNATYDGSLGADVLADIKDHGGIINETDLLIYKPVWKEPVSVDLSTGGYTLYGPPSPSSAVVLFHILNIMDGYEVKQSDRDTLEKRVLLAHRLIEAMKFGYGKRSYLGDEDFVNVTEWVTKLQSDSFADEIRRKINDDTVLKFEEYDSSFSLPDDDGTAQVSVQGPDGMAVSVTTTINHHLGAKRRGKRTGILFNNEMDDFSTRGLVNYFGFAPSQTNFIVPGKRPMSSMSPTIAVDKDGKLVATVGASGGTRIITAVIHTLLNSLMLGYNASDAVDMSRYHHQLLPDEVLHEPSFPQDMMDGLKQKGHNTFKVRGYPKEFSVVELVRSTCNVMTNSVDPLCLKAVSDKRRGGHPDGY